MAAQNYVQFTAGPGDSKIRNNEVGGYQPYSRVGEVVMNATIMTSEWSNGPANTTFAQWATALPGMIAVAPTQGSKLSLRAPGGEATAPCIVSIPKLGPDDAPPGFYGDPTKNQDGNQAAEEKMKKYFFRGIVRSPCVRSEDELVMGPSVDEFFTLAIGGAATIQNNGLDKIDAGDEVCWSFMHRDRSLYGGNDAKMHGLGPARIAVKKKGSPPDFGGTDNTRVIGRALSSAKPGQPFDILIKMI